MARKNKKRRSYPPPAVPLPNKNKKEKGPAAKPPAGQPTRETIESLVIAFVLAFLFRTFQAEAFVIPTGSMAPTLMGQHKDVYCTESGERFKIDASKESPETYPTSEIRKEFGQYAGRTRDPRLARDFGVLADQPAPVLRAQVETVAGVSPSCRYTLPVQDRLNPSAVPPGATQTRQATFSGDRILVNKYLYSFVDPSRWDVVVFKYPGNAVKNYIKRLVGLPNEDLRIVGGDVFTRPAGSNEPYEIARKPPSKILAMRQLVHDTDHDAAALYRAGWPLRWGNAAESPGWSPEVDIDGKRAVQVYKADAASDMAWLRYRHTTADFGQWGEALGDKAASEKPLAGAAEPRLITDFNAYNTEVLRKALTLNPYAPSIQVPEDSQGLHWVGDLMVEADIVIESSDGELVFELVEAGRRHRCAIDLATGTAALSLIPAGQNEPSPGFA
ncbi:MAG: S26 family signal peptidase, partial [Planctomycetota bacterium]